MAMTPAIVQDIIIDDSLQLTKTVNSNESKKFSFSAGNVFPGYMPKGVCGCKLLNSTKAVQADVNVNTTGSVDVYVINLHTASESITCVPNIIYQKV